MLSLLLLAVATALVLPSLLLLLQPPSLVCGASSLPAPSSPLLPALWEGRCNVVRCVRASACRGLQVVVSSELRMRWAVRGLARRTCSSGHEHRMAGHAAHVRFMHTSWKATLWFAPPYRVMCSPLRCLTLMATRAGVGTGAVRRGHLQGARG